ncbi:hypothetical protein Q3G72_004152 [Acer saccharum]|nr:hypothetical protein Q3G72_004152 [Acer saccharum]
MSTVVLMLGIKGLGITTFDDPPSQILGSFEDDVNGLAAARLVLTKPKNKAAYSSWSEKIFLKQSINVVPFLCRAALIEEEYYEGAGGEILVDNDGWPATHGKPKGG